MYELKENYRFIHNVLANFFHDTLDFFSTCFYDRFQYTVVGTYDKAVEYISKYCQYDQEIDKPILPALILNPSGEFLPADANAGGKQFWRYPNLSGGLATRLFDPIYQDQNMIITPAFLRIKGEIELIMLLNSFYEYCDLRVAFINLFGGMDRIIYPRYFTSFIILPENLINYSYTNPYDPSKDYSLNWSTAGAYDKLVKTIATNELVVNVNIKPQFAMTNLGDASTRYGGTDDLAEWKLTATINYEVEIPNYLVLKTDYLAENITLNIDYGSAYSQYNDYQPPEDRMIYNIHWDWNLNPNTNTPMLPANEGGELTQDGTTTVTYIGDFVYDHRYYHVVTDEEASYCDSTNDITITLPEQIIEPYILIINSKEGQLRYGTDYYLDDGGWTLVIRTSAKQTELIRQCPDVYETTPIICLQKGWVLELFVYKKLETL